MVLSAFGKACAATEPLKEAAFSYYMVMGWAAPKLDGKARFAIGFFESFPGKDIR